MRGQNNVLAKMFESGEAPGARRETTHVLRIEKVVDQSGFPALFIGHAIGRPAGG